MENITKEIGELAEIGLEDFSKKMHSKFNHCRSYPKDSMKTGYEIMAEINLKLCQMGIQDYVNELNGYERRLNGDEKLSDD